MHTGLVEESAGADVGPLHHTHGDETAAQWQEGQVSQMLLLPHVSMYNVTTRDTTEGLKCT